jgi:hypothetical protein
VSSGRIRERPPTCRFRTSPDDAARPKPQESRLSRWRHGFKSRWDYAGQRPCPGFTRASGPALAPRRTPTRQGQCSRSIADRADRSRLLEVLKPAVVSHPICSDGQSRSCVSRARRQGPYVVTCRLLPDPLETVSWRDTARTNRDREHACAESVAAAEPIGVSERGPENPSAVTIDRSGCWLRRSSLLALRALATDRPPLTLFLDGRGPKASRWLSCAHRAWGGRPVRAPSSPARQHSLALIRCFGSAPTRSLRVGEFLHEYGAQCDAR